MYIIFLKTHKALWSKYSLYFTGEKIKLIDVEWYAQACIARRQFADQNLVIPI